VILFRYLFKEVAAATLTVAAVLLVIITSGRFVKYLAQSASGDFPADLIFNLMIFRLPSFMELVLPLSLFIGILLAYGRMYMDSEMTVMRACGFSTQRLVAYTLAPAAVIMLLVALLSLFISPLGLTQVDRLLTDAGNSRNIEGLLAAQFQVDKSSGRVTYFEREGKGRDEMQKVFMARKVEGKERELEIVVAEKGHINRQNDGRMVIMESGYRYIGEPGEMDYSITKFAEMGQLVTQSDAVKDNLKQDAKSTKALLKSKRPMERATFYWRFALIFLVPIVAILAVSFSRSSPRSGRYAAMFPAFMVYLVYLIALHSAREVVQDGSHFPSFALWWVHLPFLLFAWLRLKGSDYWQAWRRRKIA
jgi:lipopolysaccharide export system permease protein